MHKFLITTPSFYVCPTVSILSSLNLIASLFTSIQFSVFVKMTSLQSLCVYIWVCVFLKLLLAVCVRILRLILFFWLVNKTTQLIILSQHIYICMLWQLCSSKYRQQYRIFIILGVVTSNYMYREVWNIFPVYSRAGHSYNVVITLFT